MATSDENPPATAADSGRGGPFARTSSQLVPVGASGLVLLGAALMRRRRAKARAQRIVRTW